MPPDIYRPRNNVDAGILKITRRISDPEYWCGDLINLLQAVGVRLQITNGRVKGFSPLSSDYIFGEKGQTSVDLKPLHGAPRSKLEEKLEKYSNPSFEEAQADKTTPCRGHNVTKHYKKGSHPEQVRVTLRMDWAGRINK